MNKEKLQDIKEGLIYGLISGLIIGLICELICGLIVGLIGGLIGGLISGLIIGLIGGLIYGLISGLMIIFITQLIALITSNPEFVMSNLIFSGILILVIQAIGWIAVVKLRDSDYTADESEAKK